MQILVVEKQTRTIKPLGDDLARNGYRTRTASTGATALEAYEDAELVVLDVDLPDIDGLEVCRRIRAHSQTPVIALTDGDAGVDRVLVLQAGADDCLDKPYEFRELLARIEAVMRRSHRPGQPRARLGHLSIDGLCINPASRDVRMHGEPVDLTRKEFDLLYHLASNPDNVLSRERLMAEVWGDSTLHARSSRGSRTIDTHVSSLRSKIGSNWIRTVHGIGFRFSGADRIR
ncbi:response regulator transcription factor [Plantactinospora sp. KLBMP9567]|uniref:response regulator transcription factor n=1 Tax=Plantactinospora sp. KLBMP9567 TaxID=3085900 RepID=UPI002980BCC3|nr:response regulator transcription factor [Plantactinospora sp. KLBMP9567]MDW5329503.1 response regulator transcription factor [Plantactinospora sp. KLBMP9567]